MNSLVLEAKQLGEALDNNEFVDAEKLNSFAKRARESAERIAPEAQQAVLEAFNDLIEAVRRHQSQTQKKIKQLQNNRKVLKKFAHIREHHRSQRLHRAY